MPVTEPYNDFFLHPTLPRHRRYEVLRAWFVEGLSTQAIAERFSISVQSVHSQVRDFKRDWKAQKPTSFFLELTPGPKGERKKTPARELIVQLRARGYASTDIHRALKLAKQPVSLSLIDQVLREQGLSGIRKRSHEERARVKAELDSGNIPGVTEPAPAAPLAPAVADVRVLDVSEGRSLYSRVAGVFLFVPFLVQAGLDALVQNAHMAGTKMIPAVSYILSLLALKLLDKERKSHITDWNFDEALGWFAGLNMFPKTTAASDYSYRLVNGEHNELMAQWVQATYPILCPQTASCFALDFHTIPHRGEEAGLENHYAPMRGKAVPSILTCFGRAVDAPMVCYANVDIVRADQDALPLQFVSYWKKVTGVKPSWLYFDSKMTTYNTLNVLNEEHHINFITIRRRGAQMVNKILAQPACEWNAAVIDTPQRKNQRIRFLDSPVQLKGYTGDCRQIAADFQRENPTLFITNNKEDTGREIIKRYIGRNSIENDIGINVNFFHMNCLASEVRLNVQTDLVMTVLANGCYRWLAQQLKGCQTSEPKQLYRKFVETGGNLTIKGEEIVVSLDRRSHNPVIAQANLDKNSKPIPWLQNKRLRFEFK